MPYQEGDLVPPGYKVETRPKRKMMTAGIATFAPLYGLSVLWAASYAGSEGVRGGYYTPMFIPGIGPFVTIATSDAEDIGLLTLLLTGAGQVTGISLFIAGMLGEEKYLLRTAGTFDPRPEVFIGPQSASLRWQF